MDKSLYFLGDKAYMYFISKIFRAEPFNKELCDNNWDAPMLSAGAPCNIYQVC